MMGLLLTACGRKEPRKVSDTGLSSYSTGKSVPYNTVSTSASQPAARAAGTAALKAGDKLHSPRTLLRTTNPEEYNRLKMDEYMVEYVDTFLIILDASGSKYLPYNGQVKLKVAKDIVRRLNQDTPDRPLEGALRRYGFEAGAFSTKTALLYDMGPYSRPDYARSIETVRWAGGKSPMALAIDKASDDFAHSPGLLSLVIVSDGKIYQGDPLEATRRIKARYGDRICIFTCLVGNLPFGEDLLKRIAEIGECGYAVKADDLTSPDAMKKWAYDIFHRVPGAPRPEAPRVVQPPAPGPCELLDEALRLVVQFDLNKWDIKPEYYSRLDRIAELMIECPSAQVQIDGHTCNIWTEKYNMKLSLMRATEVMKYLVNRGVGSRQLTVTGHGLTSPSASNKTEDGRSSNRRAIFKRLR